MLKIPWVHAILCQVTKNKTVIKIIDFKLYSEIPASYQSVRWFSGNVRTSFGAARNHVGPASRHLLPDRSRLEISSALPNFHSIMKESKKRLNYNVSSSSAFNEKKYYFVRLGNNQ